jgi:catechol 2,3-dioxygenase-like lactoylglutathione lyase family enzyme
MRPHVSINVSNVPASVEFYKKVFGVAPQKQTEDYAKFDLSTPALNFSMQSGDKSVSCVSHFGVEVDSADDVMSWQKKLTELGLVELVESDTKCCFARQDKVWVTDPDGNKWEFFYVHEQLPLDSPKAQSSCCG